MTGPNDDFANQYLEQAQKRYEEQGDKRVVLRLLNWCLSNNVPVPPWLKQVLQAAERKAAGYEIATWDEEFGKIVPKGKQQDAARERTKMRKKVYDLAQQLHTSDPKKHPISKGLFELVAKKLKLRGGSASMTDTYYYEWKAIVDLLEKLKAGPGFGTATKADIEKAADVFNLWDKKSKNPKKS